MKLFTKGLLLIAVLVIYLVLGILYESLIHPLTILSALPFAGFGAVVTLLLFDMDLSVYAFVGVIIEEINKQPPPAAPNPPTEKIVEGEVLERNAVSAKRGRQPGKRRRVE